MRATVKPKHPDVTVKLPGGPALGKGHVIIGRVMRAMKAHGITQGECDKFREEAVQGDYSHLLDTCAKWVRVK